MVTLKEEININAPFEKLLEWVDNFEIEFVKWSPYHLECELLNGGILEGNRVRFYEIVMGLDYDATGTIVLSKRDENSFVFEFLSDAKTAVIKFEGKRTSTGCYFSHTESFGSGTPIIGPIINFLIFKIIYKKKANFKLIQDDMILDNKYLKEILTTGNYPKRIPIKKLKQKIL